MFGTAESGNIRTGMFDYRGYDPVPCARPLQVFRPLQQVADGIAVNKERALEEVKADYSTTTEIADALLQKADVPFRIGHHFASKLTDYGRTRNLKLHEIPYAKGARIYEMTAKQFFPLSESDFGTAISAEHMVFGRRGIGGPQLTEMNRMLVAARASVATDAAWLRERSARRARAEASLDRAFAVLAED